MIQGKVDGKRTRDRFPVRFIVQIKNLTNMSIAEVMRNSNAKGKLYEANSE